MISNKGQSKQKTDDMDEKVKNRQIKFKGEKARSWNKICFAIFARLSKTLGHALVITRTPFNDIADKIVDDPDRKKAVKEDEKLKTFEAAIWLARRIEDILGAEKAYITSMCEHWEMWETSDGNTTEHLHFHVIPRYKGMRTKGQAAEKLLCRKEKEWDEKDLERFAKWFNQRLEEDDASKVS